MLLTGLSAILLPAYGNAFSLIHERLTGRRQAALAWSAPLLLLAAVTALNRAGSRTQAAGALTDSPPPINPGAPADPPPLPTPRAAALGLGAGAALAAPAIIWLRWPGRRAVRTAELRVPLRSLLIRLFVVTPLLVALPEEAAFRALLQRRLQHALSRHPRAANLLASLSFAAWHLTVNLHTLRRTNVVRGGIASFPLALVGGLTAVFAGGLVFGQLYQTTRGLLAPVLAHWLADALIVCALYESPPSARDLRR